ncbi:sensor histidine kinase [Gorillibacterium timonense]|uniref:sensor histidine kinase n=1 Tax=Gorillibacterium timonense TaxID=1689269 RepID=UPI00071DCA6B|nr:sensor histidine kinase [Gorillibacterium timonense]
MKLFWKEQTPLLAFYALQALLIPLLYSLLDVRFNETLVLYGFLLSLAVLVVYLVFRYLTHRSFYRQLASETLPEDWNSALFREEEAAPLSEALNRLLLLQEKHYRDELTREKNRMDMHLTFVNRWVHQMKTPVSVLQLTARELDDEAGDSIQEELERIKKGLEMVLYTARLERFEQDIAIRPVPLREVAAHAVKENRRLFIRKGIQAELQIDEGIQVYSDEKWLLFVLGQIVTNAVNYSGGPGKTITIGAKRAAHPGEVTELTVQDEGIGIVKEDLRRVFAPSFTGERGREYTESTGMGLYLVKEICTRLGHEVSITSQPEVGTTVTLCFPRPPAPPGK